MKRAGTATRHLVVSVLLGLAACTCTQAALPTRPQQGAVSLQTTAQMPAPIKLHTPTARIELGWGEYDAAQAAASGCGAGGLLVIRAAAAGVVEFTWPANGLFKQGDALARLYDPSLLPDLGVISNGMGKFAGQRYIFGMPTFGPPISGGGYLPPAPAIVAPPTDFPTPFATGQMPPPVAPTAARKHHSAQTPAAKPAASDLTPALAPVGSVRQGQSGLTPEQALAAGNAKRSDSSDVKAAAAEVAAAVECYQSLQTELDARRKLVDAGVMADSDVGRFEEQVRQAREALSTARKQLNTARAQAQQEATQRPPAQPKQHARTQPQRSAAATTKPQPPTLKRLGPLPQLAPANYNWRVPGPALPLAQMTQPRWNEQLAPSDGLVLKPLAQPGQLVKPGAPLLQVTNTNWAYLYAYLPVDEAWRFTENAPVTVTFDEYPGVRFKGWVDSLGQERDCPYLRAKLTVFCESGYYGDDAYSTLLWLAFAAPLLSDGQANQAVPLERTVTDEHGIQALTPDNLTLGVLPAALLPDRQQRQQPSDNVFTGPLSLVEFKPAAPLALTPEQKRNQQRLGKLRSWRDSFVAGMTSTVVNNSVTLTYPRDPEIATAIERMVRCEVSHDVHMCARTMREALGWGLGDAHMWAVRLPERGYKIREDGIPRPGDILVWPFTYGSTRRQHIGVAVQQSGKMMDLSNLAGTMCTAEIAPGYISFYKPQ